MLGAESGFGPGAVAGWKPEMLASQKGLRVDSLSLPLMEQGSGPGEWTGGKPLPRRAAGDAGGAARRLSIMMPLGSGPTCYLVGASGVGFAKYYCQPVCQADPANLQSAPMTHDRRRRQPPSGSGPVI